MKKFRRPDPGPETPEWEQTVETMKALSAACR